MEQEKILKELRDTEVKIAEEEKRTSGSVTNTKNGIIEQKENLIFIDITQKGTPKKTILNFKSVLMFHGISLEYDVIRREIVYSIKDKEVSKQLGSRDHFEEFLTYCEDICCKAGLPVTRQNVHHWTYYIANEKRMNYVKNAIHSFYAKHGQTGEFDRFINAITFQDNTDFSKMLFKKALWQSVAMIHNENGEYGADGSLVLQGNQAIGKTSLLRNLCSCFEGRYFKESAEFSKATLKDDIIQNTSTFICELGEAKKSIEQVDWMKRFITNPIDEIREPYARAATKSPRLTTFYMTVNDTEFLKDHENRRYWTVKIKDIDLNEMVRIDYEKLWADIYVLYLRNPVGFRLSVEERRALHGINSEFRVKSQEETILSDCLDWNEPVEDWTEKTASQIAIEIREKTGLNMFERRIGKVLKSSFGYEKKGHPRGYRILQGKTLYSTPKVMKSTETGSPFDEKSKGKALETF